MFTQNWLQNGATMVLKKPIRRSKILPVSISLLLLFSPCTSIFCQVIDASICDSTNRFPITKYTAVLKTTQLISIDSALMRNAYFESADAKAVLVPEYDPYFYWIRIIIQNKKPQPTPLMLLMAPIGMFEGKLYQKKNGDWENVAFAGLKYRFEERSYQFTHHVFPFQVGANSIDTIYLSIDASNVYKSLGFALIQPKDLKLFENKIYFVFGIIVGLLLLFFILNMSLFFALKEKLHLWYAIYIALVFLIVMKNDHLDQQFLGLDSERAFRLTPYLAIGGLAITVLIHVVQRLFKPVLIKSKGRYKLTTFIKLFVMFSALLHAVVFNLSDDYRVLEFVFVLARFSVLCGVVVIIVDCIYCIGKNFRPARFILAGSSVFMIGSIQRLFFPSTLSFLFPPTTFHVGIIIETLVVSVGLIARYVEERRDNRRKESTFTQELHRTQLEIQEQTFKQISQEIHDNIGQTLSFVKLNLTSLPTGTTDSAKVNGAVEGLSKAIQDLRDISKTLNSDTIAQLGLHQAIINELRSLERAAKIDYVLNWHIDELPVSPQQELILFRIVQEATHNIIKHSKATQIIITATIKASVFKLLISDNGVGFDVTVPSITGSGLVNFSSRCRVINANCQVKSVLGKGTSIEIEMPIETPA